MDKSLRVGAIRELLVAALRPEHIDVFDDSHKHIGHEGARDGRGHYAVEIVASAFAGRTPIERHRMIYAALGELMQTDIHALAIKASAPE